jgi:hypothetical protein
MVFANGERLLKAENLSVEVPRIVKTMGLHGNVSQTDNAEMFWMVRVGSRQKAPNGHYRKREGKSELHKTNNPIHSLLWHELHKYQADITMCYALLRLCRDAPARRTLQLGRRRLGIAGLFHVLCSI